ncbi:hypothetical protein HY989_04220 [Candidatus Micrarchaeota archaeon]|nr:hypothetical protein [Candidatus Micrarchaeota archaeon]
MGILNFFKRKKEESKAIPKPIIDSQPKLVVNIPKTNKKEKKARKPEYKRFEKNSKCDQCGKTEKYYSATTSNFFVRNLGNDANLCDTCYDKADREFKRRQQLVGEIGEIKKGYFDEGVGEKTKQKLDAKDFFILKSSKPIEIKLEESKKYARLNKIKGDFSEYIAGQNKTLSLTKTLIQKDNSTSELNYNFLVQLDCVKKGLDKTFVKILKENKNNAGIPDYLHSELDSTNGKYSYCFIEVKQSLDLENLNQAQIALFRKLLKAGFPIKLMSVKSEFTYKGIEYSDTKIADLQLIGKENTLMSYQ